MISDPNVLNTASHSSWLCSHARGTALLTGIEQPSLGSRAEEHIKVQSEITAQKQLFTYPSKRHAMNDPFFAR
jgi:hypothetical protein